MKILILGAGPTGLGAAWRLQESSFSDWNLIEGESYAGGLATSFTDDKGFTWDIGGHVQFSHYQYFDKLMLDLLKPDGWLHHERQSWVWIRDRFIPYPFQNNIHKLPKKDLINCLNGLVGLLRNAASKPNNFKEWILASFGPGLADIFMLPYNFKVWAHDPSMLNATWVGERVATVNLEKILSNLVEDKLDVGWGPNNTFQFPKQGGTGAIWKTCADRLPSDKLHFNQKVVKIDLANKSVTTHNGKTWNYTHLISTIPLTELIRITGRSDLSETAKEGLLSSSSNIIGVGLKGKPPAHLEKMCWMYFPENNCPFYRVTVFSNYSPHNVPDITKYWSLMTETSESSFKPVNQNTVVEETIQGLLDTKLITSRKDIVSTWKFRAPYGYPIPGVQRDAALNKIIPEFENHSIYSRGRFGGWKYEVSNQDHSCMQGVEIVDKLIHGKEEPTFSNPNLVNSRKN